MIYEYQDILNIERLAFSYQNLENTYALIERSAQKYPDALALSFFLKTEDYASPTTWTYAELLADITKAANMFHRLGVKRGDVVALILPNLPEAHIALWGIQAVGVSFAINPMLDPAQMAELLNTTNAQWIVTVAPETDAEIWQRVEHTVANVTNLKAILTVDAAVYQSEKSQSTASIQDVSGIKVIDFNTQIKGEVGTKLLCPPAALDDLAAYFCTGGTTGLPKLTCHSQGNNVAFCIQLDAVVGAPVLRHGRTVFTALPLFHVNALFGTGLAVFAQGGHVLLGPPAGYREPGLLQNFWKIVATHQVNSFSAVPTIFASLLNEPCTVDVSSLTAAICGAAPMPVELLHKFEKQSGLRILEGYGLTEGTCASSMNPVKNIARVGSIGLRLPWQAMKVMILDAQNMWQRDAECGEAGSVCIRGPNVFQGYLNEHHNQDAWVERPNENGVQQAWFNTGDLGRCDEEGYFWLTGREKEMIIRGGHNIDPKNIEEIIATHPDVAMCAAVGRPDVYAGEVPVVYVQLQVGSTVTSHEILTYATLKIPERAAVPKAVHLIERLPLTSVGKIFKPELVMRETKNIVLKEAHDLGLKLNRLEVEQVVSKGIVATYNCDDKEGKLADVLAGYTFSTVATCA